MFVAVVELVEFDEGPRAILSVVRLQSLNKILSGLAECSDLIRTRTPRSDDGRIMFLIPVIPFVCVAYWELYGEVIGISSVVHGQGHSEMIENGPEIVDAVPKCGIEDGGHGILDPENKVFAPTIWIGLDLHTKRVGLVPTVQFGFEVFQMLCSTRKLGIDTFVVCH